jgi:thiamine biosynthesis lipoprotein
MERRQTIRLSLQGGLGRADARALGTGVTVLTTDPAVVTWTAHEVLEELREMDRACSRFRPDSELEVANRAAGHRVAVGPLLGEAIGVAMRAAEITGGLVDPTVGEAMKVVGYDRDFSSVESSLAPVVTVSKVQGWTCVDFDSKWGTLQVPAGIQLDLGATAKALAADRAADRAHRATGCGVLVSLGGDISTAGAAPEAGWTVHVTDWHASPPTSDGQSVRIDSGGLATSGTTVRRWRRGGAEMHHIIDPSTGLPAKVVWKTASAVAATCVDANIATTASIVAGEAAPAWLSDQGLDARLVRPDGSVTLVGRWPEERLAA